MMLLVERGCGCSCRERSNSIKISSILSIASIPVNSSKKIIAIVLVRNEERFVEQAVRNIFDFCDQLLLVDHESSDTTVSILQQLQSSHPEKISFHRIKHPSESQKLLQPFIGTSTWIFGVDGDELYDPARLAAFRKRIVAGEFDHDWMILGNVLHVDDLDENLYRVSGCFAPPSRSITKLYNFEAITAWDGKTLERLHGSQPQFRDGFHEQKKRLLHHEYSWEEAPLRCLHLCFLKRSSVELSAQRPNIMEIYNQTFFSWIKKKLNFLFSQPISWKQEHYARGERSQIDGSPFFKNRK